MSYLAAAIRVKAKTLLRYRLDLLLRVAGNVVTVFVLYAFWTALYSDRGTVAGLTRDVAILYAVASTIFGLIVTTEIEQQIMRAIWRGDIALMLAYPVGYPFLLFIDSLAGVAVRIGVLVVPYSLAAWFFFGDDVQIGLYAGALFLLSAALSYVLFFYQLCFGCLAFWTIGTNGIQEMRGIAMKFLSGAIIPLWFFPPFLFDLSGWLPFQAIYHTPLSILIGKIDGEMIGQALGIQVAWMAAFAVGSWLVWRAGVRRVVIHGG